MQNQSQSSPQFCSQCGSALPPNAQFCSHCGKPIESSSNSEVASSASPQIQKQKPKSKLTWVVLGVAALFLYGIVSPVMKRSAISSREREQKLEEINKRIDSGNKAMQEDFDRMEKIAENHPALRQRLLDLRIEWEQSKDDPEKMRDFIRKFELFGKDLDEGRY